MHPTRRVKALPELWEQLRGEPLYSCVAPWKAAS